MRQKNTIQFKKLTTFPFQSHPKEHEVWYKPVVQLEIQGVHNSFWLTCISLTLDIFTSFPYDLVSW